MFILGQIRYVQFVGRRILSDGKDWISLGLAPISCRVMLGVQLSFISTFLRPNTGVGVVDPHVFPIK